MTRTSESKTIVNQKRYEQTLPKYLNVLKKLKSQFKVVNDPDFFYLVNFKTNKREPIHNWFAYKQGYASQLVVKIIEKEKPNKTNFILDPFCGVGTTNLVAQKLGYNSIGFDINPVATLASRVKCSNYTCEDIKKIKEILKMFKKEKSELIPESTLLEKSFSKKNFEELVMIKGFFERIIEEKIRNFFKLGYISIIEDCSNRVKDGNGIKIVNNKKKIEDVFSYYQKKMQIMIEELDTNSTHSESIIIDGSMTREEDFNKIKNKNIGIIIFSPPYANCFDYCEVYKLELWMGDFVKTYEDFSKYRSIAMRSHVNSKFDHTIKSENSSINTISDLISCFNIWNKNIPDMLKGYFDDMEQLLTNTKQIMVPNSKCYIVVANSGYRGVLVPTDLLIAEIGYKLGFNVAEIIHARKIRASSQQMKELHGEYENLMRESIVVLEKK